MYQSTNLQYTIKLKLQGSQQHCSKREIVSVKQSISRKLVQAESQSIQVQPIKKRQGRLSKNETVYQVEEIKGIRYQDLGENNKGFQYLVKWKDDELLTWEDPKNLSEDVVRDIEDQWWTAVRKGDEDIIKKLISGSGQVLARIVDPNRRSGLHFVAGRNKVQLVDLLLRFGANPNQADEKGYTPLHMAAGYMHVQSLKKLLQAGADPLIEDSDGRSVMALIDALQEAAKKGQFKTLAQRMALQEVKQTLFEYAYEDDVVNKVLDQRSGEDGEMEYLVKYMNSEENIWVPKDNLSIEVIEDYEKGFELIEPSKIISSRFEGLKKKYLIQWSDDYPDSWISEDDTSALLIEDFEKNNKQLIIGAQQQQVQQSQLQQQNKQNKHNTQKENDDKQWMQQDKQSNKQEQDEDFVQNACKQLDENRQIENPQKLKEYQASR